MIGAATIRAKLESGGIKYYGTLFLPPGRYTLRARSDDRRGVRSLGIADPV